MARWKARDRLPISAY